MKKKKYVEPTKYEEEEYSLKVDAVETLTKAINEGTVKEISEEQKKTEQQPYKQDKLTRIPSWIKVIFVKFWVAGAICFFFMWGLGMYIKNSLDMYVVVSLAFAFINDLFVTSAFLYFESDKKEYHKWLLVPVPAKKIWTIFVNIPIGFLEAFLINQLYALTNKIVVAVGNLDPNTIPVTMEPLLFGLFYVIVNLILLLIKNTIVNIVKDAIKKANNEKEPTN